MIEVQQDLWSVEADVHCVTTNGTVTPTGLNVMGGGCAREAAMRYPDAPLALGGLIREHGNHVYLLAPGLVAFPTKEDVRNPSTVERVSDSVYQLVSLADLYGWQRVALPRPGCGLGGLSWENDVRDWITRRLDGRFILVDFPRAPKASL